MSEPLVTIVVVPRERFSVTRRALEALYASTPRPFRLVYVDGGSPPRIRRYLAAEARSRGFELVRTERHLVPNEARNIGLRRVRTRYVVFIDNDAIPAPGWLERMVECAEETGAWVVGPLYLVGEPDRQEIHMAAGDAGIEERPEGRRFFERHRFTGKRLDEVREHLARTPCGQVEFHCMLVRATAFERLGPLDEAMMNMAEHSDLCLLVRHAGGEVYFEPTATVTYITSGRFRWSDYRYFLRRWSEAWTDATVAHFRAKWALGADDPVTASFRPFVTAQRQFPTIDRVQRALERLLGWRMSRWLGRDVLGRLEIRVNRWWVRVDQARGDHGPIAPVVSHRAGL
ncbi:MAG: glycosyltransferase [Candidatus Rokuibacteriota bacterium]|nr:MAG: glycosyltransferase [Candidatus Rokubacteria bacterium]